jgi:transcription termination factor NusB
MSGKNVDPQKYRAQNEKITDKIRGYIEKFTGKKVRYSYLHVLQLPISELQRLTPTPRTVAIEIIQLRR